MLNRQAINRYAQQVVDYVNDGNWLGASWVLYAVKVPLVMVSQRDVDEVMHTAEQICPDLWVRSQFNFENS